MIDTIISDFLIPGILTFGSALVVFILNKILGICEESAKGLAQQRIAFMRNSTLSDIDKLANAFVCEELYDREGIPDINDLLDREGYMVGCIETLCGKDSYKLFGTERDFQLLIETHLRKQYYLLKISDSEDNFEKFID